MSYDGFFSPSLFNVERNKKEKPQRRSAKDKKRVQRMLGTIKEKVDASIVEDTV